MFSFMVTMQHCVVLNEWGNGRLGFLGNSPFLWMPIVPPPHLFFRCVFLFFCFMFLFEDDWDGVIRLTSACQAIHEWRLKVSRTAMRNRNVSYMANQFCWCQVATKRRKKGKICESVIPMTMMITMATTTEMMTSAMAICLLRWPSRNDGDWEAGFSLVWRARSGFIWLTEGWSEGKLAVASDTFSNSSSTWTWSSSIRWHSARINSTAEGLSMCRSESAAALCLLEDPSTE